MHLQRKKVGRIDSWLRNLNIKTHNIDIKGDKILTTKSIEKFFERKKLVTKKYTFLVATMFVK